MTKTTLLTAASVVAVLFAGAANAGAITGTVNSVPFNGGNGATAYVVASEVKGTATNVVTPAGAWGVKHELPATGFTIGADAPDTVYRVTFTAAGGEFSGATNALSVLATVNGAGEAALTTAVVNNGGFTTTQRQYIITVKSASTGPTVLKSFSLATGLKATAGASASVSSSVELLAGGVPTTVDTGSSVTAVQYKPMFGSFSATSNAVLSALPNFRAFSATDTSLISNHLTGSTGPGKTAQIASKVGLTVNSGTFHGGLDVATAILPSTIITGGTLTVGGTAGAQLDKLTAALTGLPANSVTAGAKSDTSAAFTLNTAGAQALTVAAVAPATAPVFVAGVSLSQATTAVDIKAANYNLTFVPTYDATLYTLSANPAVAAGVVTLDGANYIAPWVGGTGAASTSIIRLGNTGGVPSGRVTVRLLNAVAAGNAVFTPTTNVPYDAGQISATGDLQISGQDLARHFGDFRRGDFQITVESDPSSITAKLRNTNATSTFEQSLGR